MIFEKYTEQKKDWPTAGRHILAQFDEVSIFVYQAYRPSIAEFAVKHQRFGGDFSFQRMSWIKPNFLWMMFRSGWATKENQDRILAIRLNIQFFVELLRMAVPSGFDPSRFPSHTEWQTAVANSDVRLQWDPDHDPLGNPIERRAVQLGLRGGMLHRFGEEALISIEDITPFVMEQKQNLGDGFINLQTPKERVYRPNRPEAFPLLGLDLDPL